MALRSAPRTTPIRPPSKTAGLLHVLGFGDFIDGIVLHQMLQWHHMVSHVDDYPMTTLDGLEANTLAGGFSTWPPWPCVAAGSVFALRAWRPGRLAPNWFFHVGLLLAGWGIFNLVEGVVDHHILGVHHVRDDWARPCGGTSAFLSPAHCCSPEDGGSTSTDGRAWTSVQVH